MTREEAVVIRLAAAQGGCPARRGVLSAMHRCSGKGASAPKTGRSAASRRSAPRFPATVSASRWTCLVARSATPIVPAACRWRWGGSAIPPDTRCRPACLAAAGEFDTLHRWIYKDGELIAASPGIIAVSQSAFTPEKKVQVLGVLRR
jgi:hypothetical protein